MNYLGFRTRKQNKFIVWCALAVAVLGIGVVAFFVSKAVEDNRGYRTIGVVEAKGNVTVVKDGIDYKAYPGMHLQEGQVLVTAGESSARLVLDGDKYIKVESGSRVVFETLGLLGSGKTKIVLERGSMTGELVNPLETGREFVVNTPNAVLAVRGTFFRVELENYGIREVRTNVLTYGGAVAAKRIFPTGETEEEEVLVESGYKTAIHMDAEDTFYVLEKTEGAKDTTGDDNNDIEPIYWEEIADDDWVDIYYSAENGHELFVTSEEAKKEIEDRNINLENITPIYEKAAEIFPETEETTDSGVETAEQMLSALPDDSKTLAMAEIKSDANVEGSLGKDDYDDGQELQSGLLTDGSGRENIIEGSTVEEDVDKAEETPIIEESEKEDIDETESSGEESDSSRNESGNIGSNGSHEDGGNNEDENLTEDIGNSGATGDNTGSANGGNTENSSGGSSGSGSGSSQTHTHIEVFGGSEDIHTKCDTCGETLSTAHEYADEVTQEATCTEDGILSYSCECGYSYEKSIDAPGHTSVNGGEAGVHSKCETCGETLSTAHEYADEVTQEATCTEDGKMSYSCECGYSYEESIPMLGHTEINGGEAGIHSKCDTCGETLNATHEYTDEVTREATCTQEGIRTYTCACGYSYEVAIDVTEHTPVYGGEEGVHRKCDICGEVLEDGAAHSLVEVNRTNATCTSEGQISMECDCGYERIDTISMVPHQYESSTNICSMCGLPMIEIDGTNFPDSAFYTFVQQYDTDNDYYLYSTELTQVTEMNIFGGTYTSLKGIEHFTQLQVLDCTNNTNLTELDLSKNVNLQNLYVDSCTGLTTLNVSNTKISTLDVESLTGLQELYVSNCSGIQTLGGTSCNNLRKIEAMSCLNLSSVIFRNAQQLEMVNVSGNGGMYDLNLCGCSNLSDGGVNVTGCTGGAFTISLSTDMESRGTAIFTGYDNSMRLRYGDY